MVNYSYQTQTHALDDGVRNVTEAFRAGGLWDNLLLVFSADNGGETGSAGNNWPLRGARLPLDLSWNPNLRQSPFSSWPSNFRTSLSNDAPLERMPSLRC